MVTLLHFADAHIDIATQGRRDPLSGLPLRVMDFLAALDQVIDSAIQRKVDLVLFAGDAYKDRNPAPTYQKEWGRRIMRLSQAGIPLVLLVGNHDMSPAAGRAVTLQEFDTLQVPKVRVVQQPGLLKSQQLWDLPLQVIALPWLYRTSLPGETAEGTSSPEEEPRGIEEWIAGQVGLWMKEADASLPTVILAHASVEGALLGNERSVMLGKDMVLPLAMLTQPGVDYVALGHIHKSQNLNEGRHPPVVYPGSIERVDFNEAADLKHFVLAQVEKGKTRVEFCRLNGRAFIDKAVRFTSRDDASQFTDRILALMPSGDELSGAVMRLTIDYPGDWNAMLDEAAVRKAAEAAFEFHLIKKPQVESRVRLPGDQSFHDLSTQDKLTHYLKTRNVPAEQINRLRDLAQKILGEAQEGTGPVT